MFPISSTAGLHYWAIALLAIAVLSMKTSAEVPERWRPVLDSASAYTDVVPLNGGFEAAKGDAPRGWNAPYKARAAWTPRAAAARNGARGMRYDRNGDARSVLVSAPFPVQEGDSVAFYLWGRSENAAASFLSVRVQAQIGGKWTDLGPAVHTIPSSTWREFGGVPAFIPHGATQGRLAISGDPKGGTGAWEIDDLSAWVTSFAKYKASRANTDALENFLILGIDTLRQSRLGCYGAAENHTPNFDAIAAEGRIYDQVTSTCPWTPPSWASILTSLYPTQHKAEFRVAPIAKEARTLPEILHDAGYFTVGIVTSGNLDGLLGEHKDFQRGFDVFMQHGNGPAVGEALSRFLDANSNHLRNYEKGGIFVFWHCYDTHLTYENRYPDLIRNEGGELGTVDIPDPIVVAYAQGKPILPADLEYIKDVYDSEIIYVDNWVRDFRLRYQRLGLWDDLNVVVCSDHGEAFAENGKWKHSLTYETMVRTPLMFRLPGEMDPGEHDHDTMVSNLDVLPTLLEVAKLETPAHAEGRSLLRPQPDAHTAKVGISESKLEGWLSIRDAQHKLVVYQATNRKHVPREDLQNPDKIEWTVFTPESDARFELYDLKADPGETKELSAELPEVFARMKTMLQAHLKRSQESAFEARPQVEESKETEEALQALGYL